MRDYLGKNWCTGPIDLLLYHDLTAYALSLGLYVNTGRIAEDDAKTGGMGFNYTGKITGWCLNTRDNITPEEFKAYCRYKAGVPEPQSEEEPEEPEVVSEFF